MIRVQPSAMTSAQPTADRGDQGSGIDFKSHLQSADSKSRPEQQKPAPKKQPGLHDSSEPDAPPPQVQAQTEAPQPLTDLGAAITRALAALQAPTKAVQAATTAPAAIGAPQTPDAIDTTLPITPLEQAVHDIIAALQPKPEMERDIATDGKDSDDKDVASDAPTGTPAAVIVTTTPAPQAAVARTVVEQPLPIAEPRVAEIPLATSHMHLVVGDGDDRIVLTVAVRGQDVNVSLRSSDDGTAAALARNAASLDHALSARGLDLASFSADRDPDHPTRRDQPERQPQRDDSAEPFVLEEKS